MASQTYLKIGLKLIALYCALMGAAALFFHDAGSFLLRYNIQDPMILRYWGGSLFALAVFYLFLSTDPQKFQLFIWVGVLDLGTSMILTIINITTGGLSMLQGIVGLVINPILLIMLIYGLAKEPQRDIYYSKPPEQNHQEMQLPDHLAPKHPLQGK